MTVAEVRSYRPGDEAEILECMRTCFRFEPDLARWRHLFLENPAGPSVIELATDGAKVVSHTAILPRHVVAFGRDGLAGHVVDSMTLPAAQRRGLKTRLAGAAMEIAWTRGFRALYSFSNEQALPGNVKHEGRRLVGALPLMVRPIHPLHAMLALAENVLAPGRAAGRFALDTPDCAVAGPLADAGDASASAPPGWTAPRFDERHSRLFRAAEGLPPVAVVRDAPHLTWRYAAVPPVPYLQRDVSRGGDVLAMAVVRTATLMGLRVALVMEWLWAAGARREGRGLVREVLAYGRAVGADAVAALAMPGTLQRRILHRFGFLGVPATVYPKAVTLTVRAADDDPRWGEPSSWYLTWGDGFVL
jgi:GNAT superfamily N-acetyltransferase